MKIVQLAGFEKESDENRVRVIHGSCAVIECQGVRFFSLTPLDETYRDKINAAVSEIETAFCCRDDHPEWSR